jgi:hypothetical protein
MNRVIDYLHKSQIQRQIMSNRSQRYGRWHQWQNIALVLSSGIVTFIGFSGNAAVAYYLSYIFPESTESTAQLLLNFVSFLLFMIGILYLVFNFGGKQADAYRAVARLAAFANEVEDRLAHSGAAGIKDFELEVVRNKYTAIMESIPENSDKEYIEAKRDFLEKETEKREISKDIKSTFVPEEQQRLVRLSVESSENIMSVLNIIRENGSHLYAGGGLIRNLIWDRLHGYSVDSVSDDVDVIYFDKENATKEHDEAIEIRLKSVANNVVWSVKNQARMHLGNNHEPYESLDDAIRHWPETCTAILCRVDSAGQLVFVSPFGFDDLVRLLVVPTPAFHSRQDVIVQRVRNKNWITKWPKLRIALSEDSLDALSR